MAPIALPSSHNLSIGCGGPSSSQIIKSRGGFVWRDLLVVWLGTLQCTFTDARGGDKLEAATAYLARKLVLNQTYDFLASCAVVVSSLLPPFAKTIKKRTASEDILAIREQMEVSSEFELSCYISLWGVTVEVWTWILRELRLDVVPPPISSSRFCARWSRATITLDKNLKKGFNSLVILVAWMLWKHRNACMFDGAQPKVQAVLSLVAAEAICGASPKPPVCENSS
ncbi:hypothetical protein U9M48_022996 [Paspalum notatum var. saurae]|uniref:Uncharacterized protein n=1 Tax=Paspalum notatum var. saurae TaxID=547442 RepID=A0AAQ3WUN2_PASNO